MALGVVATRTATAQDVAEGPTVYAASEGNEDVEEPTLYAIDAMTGEQVWAFTGPERAIESSPTVVDGTVYFGSRDETLYAVDAATGDQEWAFTGPTDSIIDAPTVVDGTVYIADLDENLYAVDAATGNQEWVFTEESSKNFRTFPVVVDETVYYGTGSINEDEWDFYAIETATGTEDQPFGTVSGRPVVRGETVYLFSSDVRALDLETGAEKWATESDGARGRLIMDETLYLLDSDILYAVDAATGDRKWEYEPPSRLWSSPTWYEGTIYVGSADTPRGHVYAVDAETGNEEWTTNEPDFDKPLSPVRATPTVAGGTVFVGSDYDGHPPETVYAFDAETGDLLWGFPEPSFVFS